MSTKKWAPFEADTLSKIILIVYNNEKNANIFLPEIQAETEQIFFMIKRLIKLQQLDDSAYCVRLIRQI